MAIDPWLHLPHLWLSVGLPGFEWESTYQGYPLDRMPKIPIKLDEELSWLYTYGIPHPRLGLDQADEHVKPLPPAAAIDMAERENVPLPAPFRRFMSLPDLQSRVRSCTACYLDPGQRVLETVGSLSGRLIHFLSDSQSCAHWYLHVLQSGQSAVLEAPDLYCYEIENSDWMENPACRLERVNVNELDFHFCSPSFSEFLFRFWIENEIWYAVKCDGTRRPLTDVERQYLGTASNGSSS